MDRSDWHTVLIRIPFASAKHALIAKQVIEVDQELQPQAVQRALDVENEILIATFSTLTVRLARLTVNAFLENVDLVVRTLEQYGNQAEIATDSQAVGPASDDVTREDS